MNTKWYVIRTVNGKERKAKELLEFELRERGYMDKIKQIIIPLEKVLQTRKGKKFVMEKNYYPGYILIEIDPSIIGEIKGLNKVVNNIIGFLGGDNPQPLRPSEVKRILGKIDELAMSDSVVLDKFIVGEKVQIIQGPFQSFVGTINKVMEEKQKLELIIKVFERETPIELGYESINRNIN